MKSAKEESSESSSEDYSSEDEVKKSTCKFGASPFSPIFLIMLEHHAFEFLAYSCLKNCQFLIELINPLIFILQKAAPQSNIKASAGVKTVKKESSESSSEDDSSEDEV